MFSAIVPVWTERDAVPVTEPIEAEIVVLPPASAVARPEVVTLDVAPFAEVQVTEEVMS